MLLIYRSERVDPLVAALGEVLATPAADSFAPELVAVPSASVERWLAQQLSHVLGAFEATACALGDALRAQLGPSDVLISGLRFTDRTKDHEADAVVLMPDCGVVVVEVKDGQVWPVDGEWMQSSDGTAKPIRPVEQVLTCKYGLRQLVEQDHRWRALRRRRVRWAHTVITPSTDLGEEFSSPDCPR